MSNIDTAKLMEEGSYPTKDYIADFLNKDIELTEADLEVVGTNNFWFYFDIDPFMQRFYVPEKKGFGGLWEDLKKSGDYNFELIAAKVVEFKSIKSIAAALENDKIRAAKNSAVKVDVVAYEATMLEKRRIAMELEALMRPVFVAVGKYFITNKLDLSNLFN